MKSRGGAFALLLLLAAPPSRAAPQAQAPAEAPRPDPVLAKAYEVRFRSLDDAARLVGGILSPGGTLTLQPGLRTLVVQDRASVLDRVASLLQSFDLPPRDVELTLTLFLGSDKREGQAGRQADAGGISKEVGGVIETLGDFTKWTSYSVLGAHSVTGIEGSRVEVRLSDEYKAIFEVDTVQEKPPVVWLRNFTLQRLVRSADGRERAEDSLVLDVKLPLGKITTIGAAQTPESRRALFLALQAKAR